MSKYRNEQRDAELDAELEREEAEYRKKFGENPEENNPEKDDNPPAANPEEETWKKRHADLRSYSQRQLNERDAKIQELESKLKDRSADPRLPANRAEAEEWVKSYPDLARVISTLIDDRAEQRVSTVSDEVKSVKMELEAERLSMARERAMSAILSVHPDFLDLTKKQEFKDWVEDQPRKRGTFGQFIYSSLYENETDAQSAIEAVNLYKSENGTKRQTPTKEAAMSVRTPSSSNPPHQGGKKVWLESEIDKIPSWKYTDELDREIEEARRDGRITYDMSGAAR